MKYTYNDHMIQSVTTDYHFQLRKFSITPRHYVHNCSCNNSIQELKYTESTQRFTDLFNPVFIRSLQLRII